MRGNSANATCTVKVSPSASTSWSAAIDLNPPQTFSGNYWTNFSGTVMATGTNITLWLDGQTGGTGLNKAECFDMVTVTCVSPAPPLRFQSATLVSPNQVRLVVSGPPGVAVTIRRSSDFVTWQAVTNIANSTGTVQFTDTTNPEAPSRLYRATMP